MKTRVRRIQTQIWSVVALGTMGGLFVSGNQGQADPPSGGNYQLTFAQLTSGSNFSVSPLYRMEEVILTQGTQTATQSSARYEVVNVVGRESVQVPVELSVFTLE